MESISPKYMRRILRTLRNGGVIAFPTETSYGLGCDATNAEAVEKIFAIKKRSKLKALPILLPTMKSVATYVEVNPKVYALISSHWPGPLNLILPIADDSPVAEAVGSEGWQSVRLSSHPVAAKIARKLHRPLVATSANISGNASIYSAEQIEIEFADEQIQPDLIVDVGGLPRVPASTTVKVEENSVFVLREGSLKL
ncbi:MAG: L-threonylcarbamoyladenylate synthase [bacterium]|nr:L-threonylcarbamoyladenylate synthase [bacterium]